MSRGISVHNETFLLVSLSTRQRTLRVERERIMPNSGLKRLYELLDALIALRFEFADGVEGQEALTVLGQAKVHEVRTELDTAIRDTKQIIGETELPLRLK